jgi:hypothetical protein
MKTVKYKDAEYISNAEVGAECRPPRKTSLIDQIAKQRQIKGVLLRPGGVGKGVTHYPASAVPAMIADANSRSSHNRKSWAAESEKLTARLAIANAAIKELQQQAASQPVGLISSAGNIPVKEEYAEFKAGVLALAAKYNVAGAMLENGNVRVQLLKTTLVEIDL